MKKATYTDQTLLKMIASPGDDRLVALQYIYTNWHGAAFAYLKKAGHKAVDIEDVIQDSVIILDNHLRLGKFAEASSLKTYFIGICRGRMYSKNRSQKRVDLSDDGKEFDAADEQHPEVLMLKKEQKQLLSELLHLLDAACQEVLELYRLSYSMQEIANEMDIGSANTARQRVFNCRKRLVALVQKHPLFQTYFKDVA